MVYLPVSIQKRPLAFTAVQWQVHQQVVEVKPGMVWQWIIEHHPAAVIHLWWLVSEWSQWGYTSKHKKSRPSLTKKESCFQREWKCDEGQAAIFIASCCTMSCALVFILKTDAGIKPARQHGKFFQSPVMFSNAGPAQAMDISQCEQKYLVSISKLRRLAHAPLGLGKVILCFSTRGIQDTLIKTVSSALILVLSPLFSTILHLFPLFSP